jgi:hypothetical protein
MNWYSASATTAPAPAISSARAARRPNGTAATPASTVACAAAPATNRTNCCDRTGATVIRRLNADGCTYRHSSPPQTSNASVLATAAAAMTHHVSRGHSEGRPTGSARRTPAAGSAESRPGPTWISDCMRHSDPSPFM